MADIYGTGLKFPFTFEVRSGGASISTATSRDHAHIHESIRQILGTRIGERFMNPEFGSRLHELLFEGNTVILHGLIQHYVREALLRWEPRIDVTEVATVTNENDEHVIDVYISYTLIDTQVEGNLIYPFFREEPVTAATLVETMVGGA